MKDPIDWAHKQGLACDDFVAAATLRQLCVITFWLVFQTSALLAIAILLAILV